AEVEEVAGNDGASAGAGVSEDDADYRKDGDEGKDPTELGSMEAAKEQAGSDDADARAGLDGGSGVGAEMFCDARAGGCEKRIEVAAENGFFDERRDEHGHTHEEQSAGTIFEEILNGKVLRRFDFCADNGDGDRQTDASGKIEPGAGGCIAVGGKFFPAESG